MEIKPPFDAAQYALDLKIAQHDLSSAFAEQASLFAHYATQQAMMLKQEAQAKMMLEIVEAKLDKRFRDEAASAGTKTTEPQLAQAISRSTEYIKAAHAYNEARAMAKLADGAVEAFRHRKDMLVQLGANQRKELEGDMSMRTTRAVDAAGRVGFSPAYNIAS